MVLELLSDILARRCGSLFRVVHEVLSREELRIRGLVAAAGCK
jgi:hypothetical protein